MSKTESTRNMTPAQARKAFSEAARSMPPEEAKRIVSGAVRAARRARAEQARRKQANARFVEAWNRGAGLER
ncbi:hypothetical protein [Pseudomarimonas arenosa]|uniref:Uncharacterized protein n=1 Tax=Pseudomarimonas arenosa TaxID=2774145 RepID=A0AAW3ZNL8_9GAMM|nr:hypothetical protein [Pseudomarimonas arenosa]MBD8526229.1 hypothetical protein [Pseudomarimonas arenosa]